MKVATVVGARPQFIKAAPVSRALRARHDEVLIHTGQHYDDAMSRIFFDQLGIPRPDHDLGIGSGGHGAQTGRMLIALEETFQQEAPDCVLVFGDTNSTLAGALAAAKLHIPVAHVEAGLRSGDRRMPEEVNRVLTDHVSAALYCPTPEAVANLAKEGLTAGVHMVGDVMVDAFRAQAPRAQDASSVVADNGLTPGDFWLVTLHRPANVDDARTLGPILDALSRLDAPVLFPLHPRTRHAVERHGLQSHLEAPGVHAVAPLGYLDMLAALTACKGVITDSGGLQKEAYIAGRPCLTVRDTTEWPETVADGWNRLVLPQADAIVHAAAGFHPTGPRQDHYGDGHAAERIAALIGTLQDPAAGARHGEPA